MIGEKIKKGVVRKRGKIVVCSKKKEQDVFKKKQRTCKWKLGNKL